MRAAMIDRVSLPLCSNVHVCVRVCECLSHSRLRPLFRIKLPRQLTPSPVCVMRLWCDVTVLPLSSFKTRCLQYAVRKNIKCVVSLYAEMLILPVSLMLLRLAANPLKSPLLGALVGDSGEMGEAHSSDSDEGCGDGDGPNGEVIVILKFFLDDLSEVAGEPGTTSCSGASSERGVVTESGIMLLRDGGGLIECLEGGGVVRSCGGWGLASDGRLLFLTRLKVLVTPFNRVMVGVLGDLAGLVASSGVPALGTSSE